VGIDLEGVLPLKSGVLGVILFVSAAASVRLRFRLLILRLLVLVPLKHFDGGLRLIYVKYVSEGPREDRMREVVTRTYKASSRVSVGTLGVWVGLGK
jgi:hypothetical protein